jgi:hypothetical protein
VALSIRNIRASAAILSGEANSAVVILLRSPFGNWRRVYTPAESDSIPFT